MRAGGNALDVQALTDATCVSTERLPRDLSDPSVFMLRERPEGCDDAMPLMRVAAWLPWRTIVRAAVQRGVLPPVVVSSGSVTPAGSISGDGLSRFSPTIGKESRYVYAIEILLPRWPDRVTTVYHPDVYPELSLAEGSGLDAKMNRELFWAIVGGHGLIGIIVAVTYWVLPVPDAPRSIDRLCVRSYVTAYEDYASFFSDLSRRHQTPGRRRAIEPARRSPTSDGGSFPARADDGYVACFGGGVANIGLRSRSQRMRMTLWESELAWDEPLDPFAGFSKANLPALAAALLLLPTGRSSLTAAIWQQTRVRAVQRGRPRGRPWVDDFEGFTYFYEQHTRAVAALERYLPSTLYRPRALQQTWALPADPEVASWFMHDATRVFQRAWPRGVSGLVPQVTDALYLAQHDAILAPNPDSDGISITFGFEGLGRNHRYAQAVDGALRTLSRHAVDVGGRVHLTKNLCMDDATLRQMYGDAFARFLSIRSFADPNRVIRSRLLERIEATACATEGTASSALAHAAE